MLQQCTNNEGTSDDRMNITGACDRPSRRVVRKIIIFDSLLSLALHSSARQ